LTKRKRRSRTRAALGFFFDFARFAELLWLGAFCGYALKLAALRAGRRPADERTAELRMTSAQSVLMYCGVYATKWALPHTWRFHEAPGLDAPSAAAAAAVAALLGSLAGWEVEAFGAELLWSLWPGASSHPVGKRLLPFLERTALLWAALALAVVVDVARPQAVVYDDQRVGTWPLAADFLMVVDAVAVLPQFIKIRQSCKAGGDGDGGGGGGGGGRAADGAVSLPPALTFWLCSICLARFIAFASGVVNIALDLSQAGTINMVEVSYCFSSGFNVALLAEFAFFAARARWRGDTAVVLPV
jgi:hypothetical protein